MAIYCPNSALAFICILGILRAGAVYVNLNALSPLEENIFVLQDRDAKYLFIHSNFESHLRKITKSTPKLVGFTGIDKKIECSLSLMGWMAEFPPECPHIERGEDDLACLFSTSGTTGRSKASQLTNKVIETMIVNANHAMPFNICLLYTSPSQRDS